MAGSPNRNLRMFGELCGDKAVKKVVLVTTMWDKALASASEEQRKTLSNREKDLKDNYWKMMTKYGASTARFTNSRESAEKIINDLLQQHEAEVLLLQEEIVDLKRALNETKAGKVLYSDLQKLLADQRETVRILAQQARDESKPQLARQLEAELERIQKEFDRTFNDMKSLKISFGKRITLFFSGRKARGVRFIFNSGITFLSYSLFFTNSDPCFSAQIHHRPVSNLPVSPPHFFSFPTISWIVGI